MSVELRPLGVRCNLACTYCYQEPQRAAGNDRAPYDIEAMKAAVQREGGPFVLFGGEPLLVPLRDLEHLLAWGFEQYGSSGVQTNGVLIGDEHVRMFKQYAVRVGVSVDGPGDLNDARWQGSQARTRAATERTLANIARLVREHHPPGLIVTLHRLNAVGERLGRLLEWVRSLDRLGIRSLRLHLLEVDSDEARALALTDAEGVAALDAFAALLPTLDCLRIDVFDDVHRAMAGMRSGSCTWRGCDPYSTAAVRGVEGDGRSSNCGRTNKDGIDFLKADRPGYERYIALATTPQEDGGCEGCRFLMLCRGQCPGTALDGDWRNRSEHCAVWTSAFEAAERAAVAVGETPVSLDPRRRYAEARLLAAWRRGANPSTPEVLARGMTPPELAPPPQLGHRLVFAGEEQRARWTPLLVSARRATWRISVAAIAARVGGAAGVVSADVGDVLALRNEAVAAGLHARVLNQPGEPVRIAVGARDDVLAMEGGAPPLLDEALPPCCAAAGDRWSRDGLDDPIWQSYAARGGRGETTVPTTTGPNLLLRGVGLDVVGYVPCSSDCEATAALVDARLAAARRARVAGLDELVAMLAWSTEWTALHGMAEVKTPVFRAVHATDYTAARKRVCRGGVVPDDGVRGLTFAYRPPRRLIPLRIEGR